MKKLSCLILLSSALSLCLTADAEAIVINLGAQKRPLLISKRFKSSLLTAMAMQLKEPSIIIHPLAESISMPAGQDLMQAFIFQILIRVICIIMDSGSTRMDIIGIMASVYSSMIRNGIPIGPTIGKPIPAIIGIGTGIMAIIMGIGSIVEKIVDGTDMNEMVVNCAKTGKVKNLKEKKASTETARLTSKKMLSKIAVILKESNLMDAVISTISACSIKREMTKCPPATLIGIKKAAVIAILEGMGIASARIN